MFERVYFNFKHNRNFIHSKYNMLASPLDRLSAMFLSKYHSKFNHGLLLGDTIDGGRLLSADLTALFTNNADTDLVICCVSAIML